MENICQFIIENIDKNSLNTKKIKLVFNMQEQEITTISKIFKVSSEHIIAFYDTSTSFNYFSKTTGICFTGKEVIFKRKEDEVLMKINYEDFKEANKSLPEKTTTLQDIKFPISFHNLGTSYLSFDDFKKKNYIEENDELIINFLHILTSKNNIESFKNESMFPQALEKTNESIKENYIKVIIKIILDQYGFLDEKRSIKIFALMNKINVASETRYKIQDFLHNKHSSFEDLLNIIKQESRFMQFKYILISLIKDLIDIDFEDNKIYNFLYENKDIFKIKDLKEIYWIKEIIKKEYQIILDDNKEIQQIFNFISETATKNNISLNGLYLSGMTIGMSVSIMELLGFGELIKLPLIDSSKKYHNKNKQQLRLFIIQEILKENQKTIIQIIDIINNLIEQCNTNTQNLQELIKLLKLASKNNETFKEREKLLYCPETLSLITINNHLKEDDIQFIEQYYTYNQNTHEYERNDNLSSSDLEKLSNFFKLKNL
ncbi:hypothetical protein G3T47_02985 [Campylobacter jejuni]|uniref:hypothetical protein n=1 Tax=Campylobacter jejuni TaxID=197 RepID=UPI001436F8BA|nr:hypothetical protein [Campylobacter jejuni]QIW68211.1 hypothetical protein G3T47_02985 [Campylobacter jejuni]